MLLSCARAALPVVAFLGVEFADVSTAFCSWTELGGGTLFVVDAAVRYQGPVGVEVELSIIFVDYHGELVATLQALRADVLAVPKEELLSDRPGMSTCMAPSSSLIIPPTPVPTGECQGRPLFFLACGNLSCSKL